MEWRLYEYRRAGKKMERQNQKNGEKQTEGNSVASAGGADELKKYKDLLDSGVITQEEFDAKKKQLLGL